jgi:Ca2+-binding RTX toxin-like protein
MLLWMPSTSSAMRQYSSDFGDQDPCTKAGVGEGGGTLTRTYSNPSVSDKKTSVKLACSPTWAMPAPSTLLAADICNSFVNRDRNCDRRTPSPLFRGDFTHLDWLDTRGNPFIHGDVAEALRLQTFQGTQAVINALIAGGASAGGALAVSALTCAVGGIPTLGIACVTAAAQLGGAAVAALAAAASAVIKDIITTQVNRIKGMGNADWFIWSNTLVTWNSFGDITDTSINPSFTNANPNPFHRVRVRIGVQFSDAAVGAAPDFFSLPAGRSAGAVRSASPSAEAAAQELGDLEEQIDSLNFNANRFGIAPGARDRIRTGDRGRDVLRGGSGDDTLQTLGGPDRASGRAGADIITGGAGPQVASGGPGRDLLFGRVGNDRLGGGSGHDVLIGHRGRDSLRGGPGSDWLIDTRGPTTVRTGRRPPRGKDRVNVRDGHGDDTVICGGRRSTVYVDAGDRVLGGCGRVLARGAILRMPG